MRPISELVEVPDPAWPELEAELESAAAPVEILSPEPEQARRCLHRLQVTARSRLGALALHTGGLVVDHGWLRVLGGGAASRRLPDLAEANGLSDQAGLAVAPALLVAFDILGGRFEVNGRDPAAAGRPGDPGVVCYYAPDTLRWEALGLGHGAWLSWVASGRTARFYAGLRWPGWEAEVSALGLDQGLSVYPFLWTAEARTDLGTTNRRAVPISEVFDLQRGR